MKPYTAFPQDALSPLFIGGNLALDFVNTVRVRKGETIDMIPTIEDAERWWLKAASHHLLRDAALRFGWQQETFDAVIQLRERLRALFEAAIAGKADEEGLRSLNEGLSCGSLTVGTKEGRFYSEYGGYDWAEDPLVTICLSAHELLTQRDLSRLRHCKSGQCTLLFYDTTKSATRHWCTPECMNRARSRENYLKSKGAEPRAPANLQASKPGLKA